MRNIERFLASLALIATCTVAAADKNLLPNGDFSNVHQLLGWTCQASTGSSYVWSSADANSVSGSGSMALSGADYYDPLFMAFEAGMVLCTSPCFTVGQNAVYHYGGQSRLISVAGNNAIGFVCNAYATASCSEPLAALADLTMSATASWSSSPTASGTLPSTAQAVGCYVEISSSGSGMANFDNLFFSTDVIFADGFEAP